MSLLFTKQKISTVDLVKLPSYCKPTQELGSLATKREAQLRWMRQKGMRYLGDPMLKIKRPARLAMHKSAVA
jgi:hypothetical protein